MLDILSPGLLMFGRTPAKARDMEQQIRTRQVTKEYVCRVEGEFPRSVPRRGRTRDGVRACRAHRI